MLEKIYINEDLDLDEWVLSFGRPEFQGGESIYIDEKTAKEIMQIKRKK